MCLRFAGLYFPVIDEKKGNYPPVSARQFRLLFQRFPV